MRLFIFSYILAVPFYSFVKYVFPYLLFYIMDIISSQIFLNILELVLGFSHKFLWLPPGKFCFLGLFYFLPQLSDDSWTAHSLTVKELCTYRQTCWLLYYVLGRLGREPDLNWGPTDSRTERSCFCPQDP